jgi:hypothetical protein
MCEIDDSKRLLCTFTNETGHYERLPVNVYIRPTTHYSRNICIPMYKTLKCWGNMLFLAPSRYIGYKHFLQNGRQISADVVVHPSIRL